MAKRTSILVLMLALIPIACGPAATDDGAAPRGPGKADTAWGSCQSGGESHCGGRSPDGCWCDDSCVEYGNCCADKTTTCDWHSPVPAPLGALRVATYNLEDVRTTALADGDDARLQTLAATIQAIRADIILLQEMAYDQDGAPGFVEGDEPGQNAARFVARYLQVPQREGLEAIDYDTQMFSSNTGVLSGFDLDNDGTIATAETTEERTYGGDCWGFGAFAGQYAFALLVRPGLSIERDDIRTFGTLSWKEMPGALAPVDPETHAPWYDAEEWAAFPLSSKNHVDVPVRLPDGAVVHLLLSHPTPPAFDGPEQRNHLRNHDEIRLWADYLDGADYVVDDEGQAGGLAEGEHFVIAGDLNADLDEGAAIDNPIGAFLVDHPRVDGGFVPRAPEDSADAFPQLDLDDTSQFRLRIDYVLPSATMEVVAGGVVRPLWPEAAEATDHFPVWIDLALE